MTLLFTTFLLQLTAFLLQFTAVTIFYCSLLFFTASYHIFTASYHIGDQNLKKKNLPKITTIYCNFTAIYNNNLLHLVVLQTHFVLFQHRNTDYFLLRYYYNLLHSYCNLLPLLFFTAFYCKLPRFTASYRDLLPKWDHSVQVFTLLTKTTTQGGEAGQEDKETILPKIQENILYSSILNNVFITFCFIKLAVHSWPVYS